MHGVKEAELPDLQLQVSDYKAKDLVDNSSKKMPKKVGATSDSRDKSTGDMMALLLH